MLAIHDGQLGPPRERRAADTETRATTGVVNPTPAAVDDRPGEHGYGEIKVEMGPSRMRSRAKPQSWMPSTAKADKVAPMATSDSREFVIEASPEEVLDVIADVETAPQWSPQHQGVEVLGRDADGRPITVRLKLKTMGITDEQVVRYTWTDNSASWTLLESSLLKTQDAAYTLTPEGDRTRCSSRSPSTRRCRSRASC